MNRTIISILVEKTSDLKTFRVIAFETSETGYRSVVEIAEFEVGQEAWVARHFERKFGHYADFKFENKEKFRPNTAFITILRNIVKGMTVNVA